MASVKTRSEHFNSVTFVKCIAVKTAVCIGLGGGGTKARMSTVADPEYLKVGFKFTKRGSFSNFHPYFLKFPYENEVIWFQNGVHSNSPNPL